MKTRLTFAFLFLLASVQLALAQFDNVQRMDESTLFFDKESNKRMSINDFQRINREFPNQYVPIAVYDKYGKAGHYVVRKKTPEEIETGHVNPFDEIEKPVIGQPVAPFVMQGAEGKTYNSEKLSGSYILLSFWLKFKKPYFGPSNSADLLALQKKLQLIGIPLVSLGISYSSLDECRQAMEELKLGFVPVPDSRGFAMRYSSPNSPSYLLIGPDGKILAHSEGDSPLGLEKHFKK
jgi:peroxiredoxin